VLNQKSNKGLAIELYNSNDLTTILANTNIITARRKVYRFNFHSIDTYTLGFASVESSTQIVIEGGDVIEEEAILKPFLGSINIITEVNDLQTLTATHTEDLTTHTSDILTKQNLIKFSTNLETNSITTNNLESNGVNINTTSTDILTRLLALENP